MAKRLEIAKGRGVSAAEADPMREFVTPAEGMDFLHGMGFALVGGCRTTLRHADGRIASVHPNCGSFKTPYLVIWQKGGA